MDLSIEWLPDAGAPEQLILLLHDWGGNGASIAPLAQALRNAFPQAAVLAPDAPRRVDGEATRRQWYEPEGLTPQNWPSRIDAAIGGLQPFTGADAQAMQESQGTPATQAGSDTRGPIVRPGSPAALAAWVAAEQQRLGVSPAATALGGLSQGAIVALALALQHDGICGRVLAFGGCLATPPLAAPRHTTVHLLHGSVDDVVPDDGSRQALLQLGELQGDATLDIAEGVGHGLHPVLIDCALHRLRTHIPLRTWQAALGAAPRGDVSR